VTADPIVVIRESGLTITKLELDTLQSALKFCFERKFVDDDDDDDDDESFKVKGAKVKVTT